MAGKPVEEVEQELKIHAVKLASNESAGPSPKAMEAARRALGDANWYPDGQQAAAGSAGAAVWGESGRNFCGAGVERNY